MSTHLRPRRGQRPRVEIRLDPDHLDRLREIGKRTGAPLSAQIRAAIANYLDPPDRGSEGQPDAPAGHSPQRVTRRRTVFAIDADEPVVGDVVYPDEDQA